MLGGTYYFWIMLGFFLSCGGLALLIVAVLWIGHWLHKKESGEKHGFLELPENLRSQPPTTPDPAKENQKLP